MSRTVPLTLLTERSLEIRLRRALRILSTNRTTPAYIWNSKISLQLRSGKERRHDQLTSWYAAIFAFGCGIVIGSGTSVKIRIGPAGNDLEHCADSGV